MVLLEADIQKVQHIHIRKATLFVGVSSRLGRALARRDGMDELALKIPLGYSLCVSHMSLSPYVFVGHSDVRGICIATIVLVGAA